MRPIVSKPADSGVVAPLITLARGEDALKQVVAAYKKASRAGGARLPVYVLVTAGGGAVAPLLKKVGDLLHVVVPVPEELAAEAAGGAARGRLLRLSWPEDGGASTEVVIEERAWF